jgi:hypothetical protein
MNERGRHPVQLGLIGIFLRLCLPYHTQLSRNAIFLNAVVKKKIKKKSSAVPNFLHATQNIPPSIHSRVCACQSFEHPKNSKEKKRKRKSRASLEF